MCIYKFLSLFLSVYILPSFLDIWASWERRTGHRKAPSSLDSRVTRNLHSDRCGRAERAQLSWLPSRTVSVPFERVNKKRRHFFSFLELNDSMYFFLSFFISRSTGYYTSSHRNGWSSKVAGKNCVCVCVSVCVCVPFSRCGICCVWYAAVYLEMRSALSLYGHGSYSCVFVCGQTDGSVANRKKNSL